MKDKIFIKFVKVRWIRFRYYYFRPLKSEDYRHDNDAKDFGKSIGLLSDYADAERYGKLTGDCGKLYGMCPFSIHSLLPKVFFLRRR